MISIDGYLIEIVSNNFLTITALLIGLKELARSTKSTFDDKIFTMLSNLLSVFRNKNNGNSNLEK